MRFGRLVLLRADRQPLTAINGSADDLTRAKITAFSIASRSTTIGNQEEDDIRVCDLKTTNPEPFQLELFVTDGGVDGPEFFVRLIKGECFVVNNCPIDKRIGSRKIEITNKDKITVFDTTFIFNKSKKKVIEPNEEPPPKETPEEEVKEAQETQTVETQTEDRQTQTEEEVKEVPEEEVKEVPEEEAKEAPEEEVKELLEELVKEVLEEVEQLKVAEVKETETKTGNAKENKAKKVKQEVTRTKSAVEPMGTRRTRAKTKDTEEEMVVEAKPIQKMEKQTAKKSKIIKENIETKQKSKREIIATQKAEPVASKPTRNRGQTQTTLKQTKTKKSKQDVPPIEPLAEPLLTTRITRAEANQKVPAIEVKETVKTRKAKDKPGIEPKTRRRKQDVPQSEALPEPVVARSTRTRTNSKDAEVKVAKETETKTKNAKENKAKKVKQEVTRTESADEAITTRRTRAKTKDTVEEMVVEAKLPDRSTRSTTRRNL